MSEYYHSRRSKNIYDPKSSSPFRLSRSKLDLFLNCPRCFYLDRRLGVGQPPGFPFSLNSAVDKLLKKEFDIHRANGSTHPLMAHYNIDAVPLKDEKIDTWRDALSGGITFLHKPSNFFVTGAIDDVWQNSSKELLIVDYKSTSKEEEVSIDAEWQIGYKRQMEVYQWLFRQNGYPVSSTGYFVYCNGNTDKEAFDARLEFDIKIIAYNGSDAWVESALIGAKKCLDGQLPPRIVECDFCSYLAAVEQVVISEGPSGAKFAAPKSKPIFGKQTSLDEI